MHLTYCCLFLLYSFVLIADLPVMLNRRLSSVFCAVAVRTMQSRFLRQTPRGMRTPNHAVYRQIKARHIVTAVRPPTASTIS